MINFRFHLISLIAVFLSLGIGVVMGSTVIDRAIVAGLKNRIETAEDNSIKRKVENERLQNDIQSTNSQDTVLAPHTVKDALSNNTVYVLVAGNVSQDVVTENRELLAVSGANLGSEVIFKTDFLNGNKSKIAKEINKIENSSSFLNSDKGADSQVMQALLHSLKIISLNDETSNAQKKELTAIFDKYKTYSLQEQANEIDPAARVSFIVLVNRSDLANKEFKKSIIALASNQDVTIGLFGSDTDQPSRAKSTSILETPSISLNLVDNIESPSGRATLLLAHSLGLTGSKNIYGISSKAKFPAPELGS